MDEKLLRVTSDLLADIKLLCPRFSMPSKREERDRLTKAWARALERGGYPPHVYAESLSLWASEATAESNAPMPGDILRFARKAIQAIEQDPVRRKRLEKYRAEQQAKREEAYKAVKN